MDFEHLGQNLHMRARLHYSASNFLLYFCLQGLEVVNIGNDFTPEEEAQVREENQWCEDA